jgi:hypothetical protein
MSQQHLETQKTYMLEIYDADDYSGPNPLHVTCVGFVHGPERTQYCIVEPLSDAEHTPPAIQLAVRPHYDGDSINRTTQDVCTVSISMARSGLTYVAGERYGFNDFELWKVGKIHPPTEGD